MLLFFSFEETYLISNGRDDNESKEYLVAIDIESNILTKIDLETGTTIQSYSLSKFLKR